MKDKALFIWVLLMTVISSTGKSQSNSVMLSGFSKTIARNFRLSDTVKKNCGWMYAIVKLNVNNQNKVTGFKVINEANTEIKQAFGMLVNGRPVVFYLAVDNLNGCTEKPGDKVFYAPNDAAATLWKDVSQVLKAYPNAYLIPDVFIYSYSKHSHKAK